MISNEIALIFVYLSGRLIFYDINGIILARKADSRSIVSRLVFGLTLLVLTDNFGAFFVLLIFHSLMILIDSFIIPHQAKMARLFYLSNMIVAIFLLPWLSDFLASLFYFGKNPLLLVILKTTGLLNSFQSVTEIDRINKFLLTIIGYFLTLKEGTIFIRLVLNKISAVPLNKDNHNKQDAGEYERGRLIGLLERTFIYFLILFNQIGAIAIVIALKSLARFNELNNKDFAEYFLIGSLLSLLVAAVPAIIVRLIYLIGT